MTCPQLCAIQLFWLHAQLFVQRIILVHEQMRPSRSSDAIGLDKVFHFFFPTHAPVGTTCLAWSHVTTSTPSFATEPALPVPQNLLYMREVSPTTCFLLTSFNHKRLRLEWAFFSEPWNGLPTPFASQRWKLFSSQFQTRSNLSHILLVNAWQDLRCRNAYRQPWVLTRQAALPGFHTLIQADINRHGTQGKLKPTHFKMFLKVSDDVINIRDKEGQSEEERHLADEFWI